AASLAYRVLPHTRLWCGLGNQVVREEYRDVPVRARSGPLRSVIVLVGGDDPLGLLGPLAARLNRIAAEAALPFRTLLICGPFAAPPDLAGLLHVDLARDPDDLRQRMMSADIAVSAAGQTLYELARSGTPTVAFSAGSDQVHNLAALGEGGIVRSIGPAVTPGWLDRLEQAVVELSGDPAQRDALARRAQSLIDGRAADRLSQALEQLVQEKKT